jgi:sterol desaturase/sphingolipid hydroxylase (fatty acid hydroxylase superfamily)
MSPILYAIPFFLGLIAIELMVARKQGKEVYRFHDSVTSLNIGFVSETIRSIAKMMSIVVYAVVVEQVASVSWDIRHPGVWIVAFFMYDFFYYWAHRSGHEINLLWASHVVHHSSEEFNLSTALRQSWTNQFFYWIFYLPMAVVGIPVSVFATTALISALYQFWVHTRLVPKLGWIDKVWVTPSNHRCHHGRNAYCIDKNYGGTLIIWDRMFGTYTEERDDEPVVYGTLTPLKSWSPVWGNLKNYIGLGHEVRKMPGWRNKLMSIFAPPGWSADPTQAMDTPKESFQRFETPTSPWQKVYGAAASVFILALVLDLLTHGSELTMAVRVVWTLCIAASTASLAMLLEGKRWGIALEAIRSGLVFGALAAGYWIHAITPAQRVAGFVAGIISLAALAMLYRATQTTSHQTTKAAP